MITEMQCNAKPEAISYMPLPGGGADVWLRQNIIEITDIDGSAIWVADEVYFYTTLSREEVEADFEALFKSAEITDTITDTTISNAKKAKMAELENVNSTTIAAGFSISLSDGNTYTFSMDSNSQSDLTGLMLQVLAGATECDYYAADGTCLTLTSTDMVQLSNHATVFRSYCTAYFHCLCDWVDSMTSLVDITAVKYGDTVPEDYRNAYLIKYATALGVTEYATTE